MTASGGYPDFRTDIFAPVINQYRCTSVAAGRRCQLWTGHLEQGHDHAAAPTDPLPPTTGRRARRGVVVERPWLRWADGGEPREQESGTERLPWGAFGSP